MDTIPPPARLAKDFLSILDLDHSDLERLLAVTSDDVKRVASAYLDPANVTLVIVRAGTGPSTGGAQ